MFQESDAIDIDIPNIRWEVFELMMRWTCFQILSSLIALIMKLHFNPYSDSNYLYLFYYRYIYTGSIEVTSDIAQDLLRAADQYLLEGLKRLCEYTIARVSSINTTCIFLITLVIF